MTAYTLFTVGHGNQSLEEFLALLQNNAIQTLVDIRSHPYSKRFPHFSQENLRQVVNAQGIDYHWAGRQLGGLRQAKDSSSHPALTDDSLRGFAEYMETGQFVRSIIQLINLAGSARTAIMCAEKLFQHCHRSLISDYLTLKSISVVHIIDTDHIVEHQISKLARTESMKLVYDRYCNPQLDLL
ncbi:DUF488 domain-containing protein [Kaarinaea lacus]